MKLTVINQPAINLVGIYPYLRVRSQYLGDCYHIFFRNHTTGRILR